MIIRIEEMDWIFLLVEDIGFEIAWFHSSEANRNILSHLTETVYPIKHVTARGPVADAGIFPVWA